MNKTYSCIFVIEPSLAGHRLDQALARLLPDYSRAKIQEWIKQQFVLLNHQPTLGKIKVKEGDEIEINAVIEAQIGDLPENIPIDILYEDEDVLVVNKAVGVVTHPGAGNTRHTLVNALLYHCPSLKELPRAGVIHRLDKDTSGALLVAKTTTAHLRLTKQLQARNIHREYDTVVQGHLISGGTIDLPIGRHPTHRTHMAINHAHGKPATTHYRIHRRFLTHTWLKVILETGRTHQIRVHMAHMGYPIVGDRTYGRLKLAKGTSPELAETLRQFPRQALHASRLAFTHPISREAIECSAPLPEDFIYLVKALETEAVS